MFIQGFSFFYKWSVNKLFVCEVLSEPNNAFSVRNSSSIFCKFSEQLNSSSSYILCIQSASTIIESWDVNMQITPHIIWFCQASCAKTPTRVTNTELTLSHARKMSQFQPRLATSSMRYNMVNCSKIRIQLDGFSGFNHISLELLDSFTAN